MTEFVGELREVLETGNDLPTLPGVVLELHSALEDEHATNGHIAAIIQRDPALTGRLLRLANSAAFNRGQAIGDVSQSLQLLGLRQVRWLCVALAVVNSFTARPGGLGHRTFWFHSAAVALIARRLASCLGYRHVPADMLYIGGLLHDVGLLVLDQFFPDLMRHCLTTAHNQGTSLVNIEAEALGMTHGDIGGLLLGRWGLPPVLVSMVTAHHQPATGMEKHRDACWLIYAAELISHGHGAALPLEGLTAQQSQDTVDAIRVADFDIDTVLADIQSQAADLASAFA